MRPTLVVALTRVGRQVILPTSIFARKADGLVVLATVGIRLTLVVALTRLGRQETLPTSIFARQADSLVVIAAVTMHGTVRIALTGTYSVVHAAPAHTGLSQST